MKALVLIGLMQPGVTMTDRPIEEQLEALQTEIQERALRLTDLEVIIRDYHREREQLLEEIIALKQQFWDLIGAQHDVKRDP